MTRDEALAYAQERRVAGAQIKREIRTERLDVSRALFDPRAEVLELGSLLQAQRGWGLRRTMKFLRYLGNERLISKRVEALTDRQRRIIAEAVNLPLPSVSRAL